MKPSSFAIVSCVHGRPAVTEAWAKHLAAHFGGPVCVAGDDPELRQILEFHIGNNLLWVPYCNQPLGAKWNRAAERAIRASANCVILGSDDFPSPELFNIWEYISRLPKYRWACLDSIYVYSTKFKELSLFTSRIGFGTGRMFPSHSLRDLFEAKGYAWNPSFASQLDASLYSNLGCPEDDVVLSLNESCWILAIKTAEQIHSYEKIREVHHHMPVIAKHPPQVAKLISWFHSQPGIKPAKPKRHAGSGKLYFEENK